MNERFRFDIRLEWLQMTNFRGFDRLAVTFHPQMTVIIGKNGAGKTAVIEAAAGLLQVLVDKITSRITEDIQGFGKKDIKNGAIQAVNEIRVSVNDEELEWNGTLTEDRYEPDVTLYDYKRTKLLDEKGEEVLDEDGNPIETEEQVPAEIDRQPFATVEQLTRQVNELLNDKNEVSLPLIQYYPCYTAQQDYPKGNGERQKDSIFNIYDNALSGRTFDFPAFFEWFRWQEQRSLTGKPDSKRIIEAIRKAVYNFLNDEEGVFDNLTIDWDVKDGELVIYKSGERLALEQFSSGERTLFLLVSDLARRLALGNPDKDNPLHGNGIVLIDEIDLHLHPAKQQEVLPKLLKIFPNVQFVATTHSPLVLAGFDRENIRILSDGRIVETPHSKGRDYVSILFEFMGVAQRPESMQKKLDELFLLLETDDFGEKERKAAREKISDLKKELGGNDPDLLKAESILHVLED